MHAPLARYLDDAADTWLGYALPRPRDAVREARWRPDRRDAWCIRCGGSVGPGEQTARGCAACRGLPAIGDAVVRLGAYRPPLREWVLAIKFGGWTAMGVRLGRRLGRRIRRERLVSGPALVVPIPMAPIRRAVRGTDHALVIADALAAELKAPLASVLTRSAGPSQTALTVSGRRRRPGRDIRPRRRVPFPGRLRLEGRAIVLVDDVITTGSTMRTAAGHLRFLDPNGILIAALAVADADRAPTDGERVDCIFPGFDSRRR